MSSEHCLLQTPFLISISSSVVKPPGKHPIMGEVGCQPWLLFSPLEKLRTRRPFSVKPCQPREGDKVSAAMPLTP